MTAPVRIHRKRTKGWKMPPNTVSVTRPGPFGNPYVHHDPAEAVRAFREILDGNQAYIPGLALARGATTPTPAGIAQLRFAITRRLRGKNLACFCALDQPCHADVLLEIANG